MKYDYFLLCCRWLDKSDETQELPPQRHRNSAAALQASKLKLKLKPAAAPVATELLVVAQQSNSFGGKVKKAFTVRGRSSKAASSRAAARPPSVVEVVANECTHVRVQAKDVIADEAHNTHPNKGAPDHGDGLREARQSRVGVQSHADLHVVSECLSSPSLPLFPPRLLLYLQQNDTCQRAKRVASEMPGNEKRCLLLYIRTCSH